MMDSEAALRQGSRVPPKIPRLALTHQTKNFGSPRARYAAASPSLTQHDFAIPHMVMFNTY